MRIIAGTARGRQIIVPPGEATRPTSDRVREAIFNALYSLDAIEGADVCDLFAGSGALGLEALSRGARRVTFVERHRKAHSTLVANIATLEMQDRAHTVMADVNTWPGLGAKFDLLLVDPPYDYDRWAELLDRLQSEIVVVESDREIESSPRWRTVRVRRYGTTVVTILGSVRSKPSDLSTARGAS